MKILSTNSLDLTVLILLLKVDLAKVAVTLFLKPLLKSEILRSG